MFKIFARKKTEQALEKSKRGWFGRIAQFLERGSISQEMWDELEESLVAADVGMDTTARLLQGVKERVKREKIEDRQQLRLALKDGIISILEPDARPAAAQSEPKPNSPQVILVVGVNGSGKTTSIAKLAYSYRQEGRQVILAAADTFRAAAIDQLKIWGGRVGAEVIAHQPGADPGAVVFDAIQAAKSRGAQVVIVDTAGRLHTKFNLMEELKKVKRASQRLDTSAPHEVLLVMDATTGQNGLTQARYFTEAVGVSGIILAKLDSTAKGGIVLAIRDQLNIPIQWLGTGETLEDLVPFDAQAFAEALLS